MEMARNKTRMVQDMRHRKHWPRQVAYENKKYSHELLRRLDVLVSYAYAFSKSENVLYLKDYGAVVDSGYIEDVTNHRISFRLLLNYSAILWLSRNLLDCKLRFQGSESRQTQLLNLNKNNALLGRRWEDDWGYYLVSGWSSGEDEWVRLIAMAESNEREFVIFNLTNSQLPPKDDGKCPENSNDWINLCQDYRHDYIIEPRYEYWVNIPIKGNEGFIAKTRFHGIVERQRPSHIG